MNKLILRIAALFLNIIYDGKPSNYILTDSFHDYVKTCWPHNRVEICQNELHCVTLMAGTVKQHSFNSNNL